MRYRTASFRPGAQPAPGKRPPGRAGRLGRRVAVLAAAAMTVGGLGAAQAFAAGGTSTGPFIYVANMNSSTVAEIDASTGALVTSISVRAQPFGVVVSPDGSHVYVSSESGASVAVIDTSSNTVTSTIPLPGGATGTQIALSPNGTLAYVVDQSANAVAVINTASDTVTASIGVGGTPLGVVFGTDGAHAYVANEASGNVSVINTATNTVSGTITVGAAPRSIAVSPDGAHLYVANYGSNTVSVISTATDAVTATIGVGTEPWGVALSPDGSHAYVSNFGANTVSTISTLTNTVIATTAVGTAPLVPAVTADGSRVYVSNQTSGTLSILDGSSGASLGSISTGGGAPVGVAIRTLAPAAPTASSVTLTSSPGGSVAQGNPVTLTAAVTPSTAGGSVAFYDGAQAIGTPVNVSSGSASLTTSGLTAGLHTITARFTPSSASFIGSTSPALSFIVNVAGATSTGTALTVAPSGTSPQYSPVSLTAAVTPATAVGTVQFQDTANGITNPLGAPVTVGSDGTASLTTTSLAAGNHTLTAVFIPTDSTAFNTSLSAGLPFMIGAPNSGSTGESITTTVISGALVISVANSQVILPTPVLDSTGGMLTTTGALNPITLTDTRAGNPGWTLTCQIGDFTDSNNDVINGQNLGFAPQIVDLGSAQTATAGSAVAPAAAVAPGDTGTAGLKSPRTLVSGQGLGTAHFSAALSLNVPTSTVSGTYTATLTITAI
jgi:YVTN family beta-propeller protein